MYSSNEFLDILPAGADKKSALEWLIARKGWRLDQIVISGDSENDLTMFSIPAALKILPCNALSGLADNVSGPGVYRAKQALARGTVEGMEAFLRGVGR